MICITLQISRFSECIRQCFTKHINWFSRKISDRSGGGELIVLVFQIKAQFSHILIAFVLQDQNHLSMLLNGSTTNRKSNKSQHYHPVQMRYIFLVPPDEDKILMLFHMCTTGLHTCCFGVDQQGKGKALTSSQVCKEGMRHTQAVGK